MYQKELVTLSSVHAISKPGRGLNILINAL